MVHWQVPVNIKLKEAVKKKKKETTSGKSQTRFLRVMYE